MTWGKADTEGTKIIIRKKTYCTTAKEKEQVQKTQSGVKTLEYTRAEKEDQQQQVSFVTQCSP